MGRGLTVRYLRRRFWIAELILIGTLAASAAIAFLTLTAQEKRSDYALALQHIGNAVDRVEGELDDLILHSRRGAANREAARGALADLLARFHAIVVATGGDQGRAIADGPGFWRGRPVNHMGEFF